MTGGPERRTRRVGFDRGATLVEYSLLLGAFVLVVIGGISALTSSATDSLAASAPAAGSPAEVNGVFGPRGAGSGGPVDPGGGGTEPVLATVTLSGGGTSGDPGPGASGGDNWIATATVRVTDSDGSPVSGATGTLARSRSGGGSALGSVVFTTGADGRFTDTVTGNSRNQSVTFTVTAIEAEGVVFSGLPSITVTRNSSIG